MAVLQSNTGNDPTATGETGEAQAAVSSVARGDAAQTADKGAQQTSSLRHISCISVSSFDFRFFASNDLRLHCIRHASRWSTDRIL